MMKTIRMMMTMMITTMMIKTPVYIIIKQIKSILLTHLKKLKVSAKETNLSKLKEE